MRRKSLTDCNPAFTIHSPSCLKMHSRFPTAEVGLFDKEKKGHYASSDDETAGITAPRVPEVKYEWAGFNTPDTIHGAHVGSLA
ncbi:MAG: hypothetical protein L7W43_04860 [Rubripirellula sp.]|nr:hypothetical protein [Rubripirellula sp.]